MLIVCRQYQRPLLSMLFSSCLVTSLPAVAGAFQLNEYSSAGLGRSYAGEGAIADSVDSASRNPATIMMFSRPGVSAGAIFVDPDVTIYGKNGNDNLTANNVAPTAWVPDLHIIAPINPRVGISFSVNSNYGLGTKYNPDYFAGEVAGTTSLASINSNISGALRISPHWSVGLGFDAVYAQAEIERFVGFHSHSHSSAMPIGMSLAHLKGNGWGYGWNTGVLWQINDTNRYSLAYRAKIRVKFRGNYRGGLPESLNQPGSQLPWGSGGKTINGKLIMELPESWELSGYNRVAAQWAIHYSLLFTRWSQFQRLQATGDNGQTLFDRAEYFHNVWRIALGSSYYLDDNWTLRGGIAFDQSPIPPAYRSVSIPDQNRLWLSAGARYTFNQNASVDVGLSWMHGQELDFSDAPYSNLHSHATAWLYGMNFNYLF